MRHKKTHRKSRAGCVVCKKRKIKCDEGKPSCTNCINFRVRCSFEHHSSAGELTSSVAPLNEETPAKRRRGRPRNNWRLLAQDLETAELTSEARSVSVDQHPGQLTAPTLTPGSLNVADLELLIHFTSHTGPSIAHPDPADNSIARFWSNNVPQIGLTCHTVLHLALALSAHHLVYSSHHDIEKSSRYLALAAHHSSTGIAGLTQSLQNLDDNNCGPLYVAAVLVSFCTFAAGPVDPDDLLVCNISNQATQSWMSVVQGVRLIRERFEPSVLFSGLMSPLDSPGEEHLNSSEPRYVENNFPRVDWEGPLYRLREMIASSESPDAAVCLEAYHVVEAIYEATYGKGDGSITCPARHKFVFVWLYGMDPQFVRCLQQRHPLSLLVLAYYAFLLTTMQRDWFIQSWPGHLLTRIYDLIDRNYVEWLRWPLEQAGLPILDRHPEWLKDIMT
ncbi:hypothetical protein BDV12DRAFT_49931 [Aspergillus spectabilis]